MFDNRRGSPGVDVWVVLVHQCLEGRLSTVWDGAKCMVGWRPGGPRASCRNSLILVTSRGAIPDDKDKYNIRVLPYLRCFCTSNKEKPFPPGSVLVHHYSVASGHTGTAIPGLSTRIMHGQVHFPLHIPSASNSTGSLLVLAESIEVYNRRDESHYWIAEKWKPSCQKCIEASLDAMWIKSSFTWKQYIKVRIDIIRQPKCVLCSAGRVDSDRGLSSST